MDSNCNCHFPEAGSSGFESTYLGSDEAGGRFGDVNLMSCKSCGTHWLHYYYSVEGISRSGKWWRAKLVAHQEKSITAGNALKMIESAPWYFAGGSYYDGKVHKMRGPVEGGTFVADEIAVKIERPSKSEKDHDNLNASKENKKDEEHDNLMDLFFPPED
jgi:hypothetical protein